MQLRSRPKYRASWSRKARRLTRGLSFKFALFIGASTAGLTIALLLLSNFSMERGIRQQLVERVEQLIQMQARLASVQLADWRLEDLDVAIGDLLRDGDLEYAYVVDEADLLLSDGGVGGEYAAYDEISIKRRVSREGQSEYFLNGTKCRRRDITDIFLGTGLGPRVTRLSSRG